MNKRYRHLFEHLGLSLDQAQVYYTLLTRGPQTIAEIARHTAFSRTAVYRLAPSLAAEGLASEARRGKRTVYAAESPHVLEERAERAKSERAELLPELLALYREGSDKPTIRVYSGPEGIRQVFSDMVNRLGKGETFYRYESHKNHRQNRSYLPQKYFTRTGPDGDLNRYIITNEVAASRKKPRLGRLIKNVPARFDVFTYNISQIVYADTVAFVDYNSMTAWVVENATFAEFQKKLFRLLFELL